MSNKILLLYLYLVVLGSVLISGGCATTPVESQEPHATISKVNKIAPLRPQTAPAGEFPEQINGKVIFKYVNSNAGNVYIAGDFNNWSKASHPMTNHGEGIFSAEIELEPGTYLYKFVVDGDWIIDPDNVNTIPDGYGGENSVVNVR